VARTDPAALTLRAASPADAAALGEVYVAARTAAFPAMPPSVHTEEEDRAHWGAAVARCTDVWVAERAGRVVGFAALTGDWLDALYVHPDSQGHGVGAALLDLVRSSRPAGFSLWVFESNLPARRLYEGRGLVTLERTDGADNEEHQPDLRMAWLGEDPLAFLRRQVDAVDDELAALLARRAALTAAIQPVKPVSGHAGRDADREAEIAGRMASRAPALGAERLRRIMHEVITASLDAVE
jgi:chorismate mutase/GNAT superfamily N-acetyltransferase